MKYDVYSYGMISTSKLIILENKFPKPDYYAAIKNEYKMIGGEATNSSIVLSKFGFNVKLDGNWLGNTDDEIDTRNILNDYNIDTSSIMIKENYIGAKEIVIAAENTRTIFGTYGKLFSGERQWNIPTEDDILRSKYICLDPFFSKESSLVAEICLKNNKPYVTVDCRHEDMIAQRAEVIIISGEFRGHQYKNMCVQEVFKLYRENCEGLVILTSGDSEILFSRKGEKLSRIIPCKVEVIDTAGAGDSFRSGIIYGLINNWEDEKIINFATGVAALVCQSFPGVLNSPTVEEVFEFLNNNVE